MRYFNTSGPNIPKEHYTILRNNLIKKGIDLVEKSIYFTIWAPRQTGKSTYFRQLAIKLEERGYKVAHINFENYKTEKVETFIERLKRNVNQFWNKNYDFETIPEFFRLIETKKQEKCVLIIDEVEEIDKEYLSTFLHSVRWAYHSRESHCLKSVIFGGVSNILIEININTIPFNIADDLEFPYFTDKEVYELLGQHEAETGQLFDDKVKQKISEITANQPGLVNGFAKKLVDDYPDKKHIDYEDYLKVENSNFNEAIDKNFENILNKAKKERSFVEQLLFIEQKISFKIDRPSIKLLYTNGLIKKDEDGFVTFWVPFYKKRLYDAFYPHTNGEKTTILRNIAIRELFDKNDKLKIDNLINSYKAYVKRRGFKPFMEKDENGNYKSIKEAALIYSFETYIHALINELEGKIYREANTGLGKSDMIINVRNDELLIETKIYSSPRSFSEGKEQLSYYCKSLGQNKGIYLVYCPNDIRYPETVKEQTETINDIEISTFLIEYDETTW